jgi:hypothetical protein
MKPISEMIDKIEIPKNKCDGCYYFTHSGNYEERYCGLYMMYTNNDTTDSGKYRFKNWRKPKFCRQKTVEIVRAIEGGNNERE